MYTIKELQYKLLGMRTRINNLEIKLKETEEGSLRVKLYNKLKSDSNELTTFLNDVKYYINHSKEYDILDRLEIVRFSNLYNDILIRINDLRLNIIEQQVDDLWNIII